MNNEMTVSGAENDALKTFDRKELIEGVVRKHKRFLDGYNSEFNELAGKMRELQDNIESSKKNRADILEKIEILAEKRQLFYHQAEKLLDELKDAASDNNDLSRSVSFIKERLSKVKGALPLEEEQKQVNSILTDISALGSKTPGIEDRLDALKERINEALNSRTVLDSIDSSEEAYNNRIASFEEEINEIAPRHKWLENRIQSHTEALQYWENGPLADVEHADDANEVKA
ncbi:hypothetical protein [Methanolobus sp. WCC5]|jgi:chromosome segregation ATPase|uniref:hypothetical protein n=1 Tax=Methanolobus sp. WCC5 TaxID=3125785 RepID=UPI003249712F